MANPQLQSITQFECCDPDNYDSSCKNPDCDNLYAYLCYLFDDEPQITTPELNIFSSTEQWNEHFTMDEDEETTQEFPRFETRLNFSKNLHDVLNKWWDPKKSTDPLKSLEFSKNGRESFSTEFEYDKSSIIFKNEFRKNISVTDTAEVLRMWEIFMKKVIKTLVSITKVYLEERLDFKPDSSLNPCLMMGEWRSTNMFMENFAKIEDKINDFIKPVHDEAAILKIAETARQVKTRYQLLKSVSVDNFFESLEPFLKSCFKNRLIRLFDQKRFDYLTESEISIVDSSPDENEFQEPEIILDRVVRKYDSSVDWFLKTRSRLTSYRDFEKSIQPAELCVLVDPKKRTIMLVSNENLPETVLTSIFDKYFPDSGKIHELVIPLEVLREKLVKKLILLDPLLTVTSNNSSTKDWSYMVSPDLGQKNSCRKYKSSISTFYQSIRNVIKYAIYKNEIISTNSIFDFGNLADTKVIKHFEFKVTPEHKDKLRQTISHVTVSYRLDEKIQDHEITGEQFLELFVENVISKSDKPENIPGDWRSHPWFFKIVPRLSELCAVCWCEPATSMFVPCGHRVLCQECRDQGEKDGDLLSCPICRGNKQSIVKYAP